MAAVGVSDKHGGSRGLFASGYQELATIYAHLDSTTTIGLSANNRANPYRTDRRTSKIVERFSDGSERVTFIFWATKA